MSARMPATTAPDLIRGLSKFWARSRIKSGTVDHE